MQTITFIATSGDLGPNGMSRQPTRTTFNDMRAALGFNDAIGADLRNLDIIIDVESDNETHTSSKYDYRSSWAVLKVAADDQVIYHRSDLDVITPQPQRKSLITKHNFIVKPEVVIDHQLEDATDLTPFWLTIETEDELIEPAETDNDYDRYDSKSSRQALEDYDMKLVIAMANNKWGKDNWYRFTVINDVMSRNHEYNPNKR